MVVQVARGDYNGLVVLALLELLPPTAGLESIEEDFLPVDLVVSLLLRLLGIVIRRLDQIEERIIDELLLKVLLEVEQGHIEQVHRLIEAWIDPEFLPEPDALL